MDASTKTTKTRTDAHRSGAIVAVYAVAATILAITLVAALS
mgnify:FL=1